MRAKTKRSKKVQQLLYSTFRGNKATFYGSDKMLSRALDPRANGTWLSKLTE